MSWKEHEGIGLSPAIVEYLRAVRRQNSQQLEANLRAIEQRLSISLEAHTASEEIRAVEALHTLDAQNAIADGRWPSFNREGE
jgi:SOS-response transcriptional repressor LexA